MTHMFSKLRGAVGTLLRGVGNLLNGGAGEAPVVTVTRRSAGSRAAAVRVVAAAGALVIGTVFVTGASAQEKYDGSKKNTIFFGSGPVGYERAITRSFSVGAELGLDLTGFTNDGMILMIPFFLEGFGRWYPWQKIFFVQLGLGFARGTDIHVLGSARGADADINTGVWGAGFLIKPQVGWKIDIGEANAWIFEIRAGLGFMLGEHSGTIPSTALLFGRMF